MTRQPISAVVTTLNNAATLARWKPASPASCFAMRSWYSTRVPAM